MKKGKFSPVDIRIIYIFTTLFLLILSIYTFTQIKSLIDSSNSVNHTTLVTQCLHKISSEVFEAETNKRGYLLTGDKSMLVKKEVSLVNLSADLIILKDLLTNNKVQEDNLKQLYALIQIKIASLNSLNILSSNLKINSFIKKNTLEGSATKDSVIQSINKIYCIETGLLLLRSDKYARLSLITPLYVLVLFLGTLAILWTSYIKIKIELFHSKFLSSQLIIQTGEIELEALKLSIANKELEFQNKEKEHREAELIIANRELAFQNKEKEQKAVELLNANKELALQNKEKEQRAAELIIANKELAFQNKEKERKSKELAIINDELVFVNEMIKQKSSELTYVNNELRVFNQIASHDLQEPLRKIELFSSRILDTEYNSLSANGKIHFGIIGLAATRMRTLIEDLINYSQTKNEERVFKVVNLNEVIEEVIADLEEIIVEKLATIKINNLGSAKVISFQIKQLFNNIISNSLKFSNPGKPTMIIVDSVNKKGKEFDEVSLLPENDYCHIGISDNGIGFEEEYNKKIFEVFQRLHGKDEYEGNGIGLAIVKIIVENHNGMIKASGKIGKGARFDIYLPL